ncbi:hypothetical protein VMCG_01937 [Cytospora schulzeri]|uniref:Uncharacterized protein n=1 Tax=Cytospora schulzeri TaxID=448051 RepID=A0A423X3W1_9PEZI|nr:hypothetical protein VMCG_01937 [Valsa malicola]
MADKSSSITAQQVRSILEQRVAGYQLLLYDNPTPLFNKELLNAIKLHEEALQRPDPSTFAEEKLVLEQLMLLHNVDKGIMEHWKELHKSPNFRTALLAAMFGYQNFFTLKLLLDYAGKSQNVTDLWLSNRLKTIDAYYSVADKSKTDKTETDIESYKQSVTKPLKELMLNQVHVEKRIKIAAASNPTGDIYPLIDQCNWPNLAAMLISDRELAEALFSGKPLDPQLYNDDVSKVVLQNMDRVKSKYFTDLSTPSTYTLSKHAKELSAKKAAQAARQSSGQPPLSPATIQHSEDSSAVTAAKNIYNKVVNGLGLGGTGRSLRDTVQPDLSAALSRVSLSSTTPLIDPRKKED